MKVTTKPGIVLHAFEHSTQRQRWVHLCELEASLIYIESFRSRLHSEILSHETKQSKTKTNNNNKKPSIQTKLTIKQKKPSAEVLKVSKWE